MELNTLTIAILSGVVGASLIVAVLVGLGLLVFKKKNKNNVAKKIVDKNELEAIKNMVLVLTKRSGLEESEEGKALLKFVLTDEQKQNAILSARSELSKKGNISNKATKKAFKL